MDPRKPSASKLIVSVSILVIAIVGVGALIWRTSSEPPVDAPPVADAEPQRKEFGDTLAALAKAGQIVRVEDLQTPPVNPDKNAAVTLRAAGTIANRDTSDAFDELTLPQEPTDEQWTIIEENVYDLSPALKLVDQAEKQTEVDWEVQWGDPIFTTVLPQIGPTAELAKILAAAAMSTHRQGQDDQALHRVSQMLMVCKALDRKPFLITHRRSLEIAQHACEQTEWFAPTLAIGSKTGNASRAEIQQLIHDLLADEWVLQRHHEALAIERLGMIYTTRTVAEGRVTWPQFCELLSRNDLPTPTHGQIYTDGRLMLPYMDVAREAMTAKTWPAYLKNMERVPPGLDDFHQHPFCALIPEKTLDQSAKASYEIIARLRIAATLLALRAYAVDHDEQPPPTLESLVPKYLPRIPMDPMLDHAPFVYDPASEMPVHGAQAEPL